MSGGLPHWKNCLYNWQTPSKHGHSLIVPLFSLPSWIKRNLALISTPSHPILTRKIGNIFLEKKICPLIPISMNWENQFLGGVSVNGTKCQNWAFKNKVQSQYEPEARGWCLSHWPMQLDSISPLARNRPGRQSEHQVILKFGDVRGRELSVQWDTTVDLRAFFVGYISLYLREEFPIKMFSSLSFSIFQSVAAPLKATQWLFTCNWLLYIFFNTLFSLFVSEATL